MVNKILSLYKSPSLNLRLQSWVQDHYLNLAIFNIILLLMILLRSAGYFEPVFSLSINFIILTTIILSVILLGADSKVIFAIAIFFLIASIPFRLVSYLEVWAERTSIFAYEAVVIGVILFIKEVLTPKK